MSRIIDSGIFGFIRDSELFGTEFCVACVFGHFMWIGFRFRKILDMKIELNKKMPFRTAANSNEFTDYYSRFSRTFNYIDSERPPLTHTRPRALAERNYWNEKWLLIEIPDLPSVLIKNFDFHSPLINSYLWLTFPRRSLARAHCLRHSHAFAIVGRDEKLGFDLSAFATNNQQARRRADKK